MADDYTPRWPVLQVTRVDTGERIRVNPRDGDMYQVEKLTGVSYGRMDWAGVTAPMQLAFFALKREKRDWVPDDVDAFAELADVEVVTGAADQPGEQGKASGQDQPTG